jgi:hypothetical protein
VGWGACAQQVDVWIWKGREASVERGKRRVVCGVEWPGYVVSVWDVQCPVPSGQWVCICRCRGAPWRRLACLAAASD